MYCSQCGKQIPDTSKFCSFCGARVYSSSLNDKPSVARSSVDQGKLEQDIRKGTLVYLHDVLAMEFSVNELERALKLKMEFSVNELERALKLKKDEILIHDDWFYWKCFKFSRRIKRDYDPDDGYDYYYGLYLSYSYKLNRYYYMFDEGQTPYFTDINGNKVNHQFGNPCHNYYGVILDAKKRAQLCTPPILEKKLFSGNHVITNSDSTYWSFVDEVRINKDQLEVFSQVKPCIEQFEMMVRDREKRYQENLPGLKADISAISKELSDAKRILNDLYGVNVIPAKYRNIGCAYFIYDFFSTSNVPLTTPFHKE